MPLIRGHHSFDNHFTQIPNEWVRDTRLSFKARGLLTLLMSHSPGWNMSIRSIARANGTGLDTVKSAVMELEQNGYLIRSKDQNRTEEGTFADFEWVTSDPFQNPVTGKPRHGKTEHKEEQDLKEEHLVRTYPQASLEGFGEFWKVYPRKVEKIAAQKAFEKALQIVTADVIIDGARRYANDPNRVDAYTAHPSTWLNAGRWDDEPLPERVLSPEERKQIEEAERIKRRDLERERLKEEQARRKQEEERLRNEAKNVRLCTHNRVAVICPKCTSLSKSDN